MIVKKKKLIFLSKHGDFTQIGNFTLTLKPEMLESQSKAQKTQILA